MSKAKKVNCKWCGMGHAPRSDGNHWIVRSLSLPTIDIKECAYHKAVRFQLNPTAEPLALARGTDLA